MAEEAGKPSTASDLRRIPRTGAMVSALGLGTAQMGGLFRPMPLGTSFEILQAAWDAGIRYVDTAPYYGYTRSERRVGCFLSERDRDTFAVSTKVGRLMVPSAGVGREEFGFIEPLPFPMRYDYSHDAILRSFEDSQQRLGLTRVDLLFVHDIGRYTHGDAHDAHWQALTRGGGFRALERLKQEGGIGGFGLGANEAAVITDALGEAELDAVLLAGRHTLLEQDALPLLDTCHRAGTAVVVGGPFNSGILAGGTTFDYATAPPAVVERVTALRAICAEFDVPMPAAALQFPLAHPAVISVLAGAESADQLRANVVAFERPIPAAFWAALAQGGLVAAGTPLPAGA
jgi:D-threo-aldose 1-dehydrogenase